MGNFKTETIAGVSTSAIEADLSQFKLYQTAGARSAFDTYAKKSHIDTPHAIQLFPEFGEFRIAKGGFMTHPELKRVYNFVRTVEGKKKANETRSGVVFSLKSEPEKSYIRLDIEKNQLFPEIEAIIENLSSQGFTIFDATYEELTTRLS